MRVVGRSLPHALLFFSRFILLVCLYYFPRYALACMSVGLLSGSIHIYLYIHRRNIAVYPLIFLGVLTRIIYDCFLYDSRSGRFDVQRLVYVLHSHHECMISCSRDVCLMYFVRVLASPFEYVRALHVYRLFISLICFLCCDHGMHLHRCIIAMFCTHTYVTFYYLFG